MEPTSLPWPRPHRLLGPRGTRVRVAAFSLRHDALLEHVAPPSTRGFSARNARGFAGREDHLLELVLVSGAGRIRTRPGPWPQRTASRASTRSGSGRAPSSPTQLRDPRPDAPGRCGDRDAAGHGYPCRRPVLHPRISRQATGALFGCGAPTGSPAGEQEEGGGPDGRQKGDPCKDRLHVTVSRDLRGFRRRGDRFRYAYSRTGTPSS
jgi:hypothetical protein